MVARPRGPQARSLRLFRYGFGYLYRPRGSYRVLNSYPSTIFLATSIGVQQRVPIFSRGRGAGPFQAIRFVYAYARVVRQGLIRKGQGLPSNLRHVNIGWYSHPPRRKYGHVRQFSHSGLIVSHRGKGRHNVFPRCLPRLYRVGRSMYVSVRVDRFVSRFLRVFA